MKNEHEKC